MAFVDLPANIIGSVSEESAKITARLAKCKKEEAGILKSISDMANEWMPVVQKISDYWGIMRDRYLALAASDATSSTVRTTFWVPESVLPDLQKQVESAAPGVTAFVVSDPTEEDKPPSLLLNNAFSTPAEVLTTMYSTSSLTPHPTTLSWLLLS
jgi:V/A-type H+-transporting ATPase subunit I